MTFSVQLQTCPTMKGSHLDRCPDGTQGLGGDPRAEVGCVESLGPAEPYSLEIGGDKVTPREVGSMVPCSPGGTWIKTQVHKPAWNPVPRPSGSCRLCPRTQGPCRSPTGRLCPPAASSRLWGQGHVKALGRCSVCEQVLVPGDCSQAEAQAGLTGGSVLCCLLLMGSWL